MAGKIPQSFIDDLIDRTDIVELIDARVKLKKTGRNYSACCPFHDEKTPSFSVNPDKQFYYCFGCGAGGNVVSFIMDYDRSDFIETIETLAAHNGMQVPREHNPQAEKLQKTKKSIYDLLQLASEYYQIQLRQHGNKMQAVNYLKQRGLSGEIAQQFQLGYAPPGWDNLLKNIGETDEQQKLLMDGGMLIEKDNGGYYDRFRERLIFPIRDSRGRTIGFGGRVFNDDKPKYLNSPETPVFHKQQELYGLYEARQANRHLQRLVMVEGYMDVVALAQFGISYAVATLGTAAGPTHMEKVFRQCSEVIFCFDGDDAGRKAAHRALEAVIPLMEAGRQARFLFLPQGEDPDSHIRNIGTDAFVMQLDSALSLSEYLFQDAEDDLDLSKPDDKASLVNKLMPHIQSMPSGTFQELMFRSLSEKSGLPVEDIKRLQSKAAKNVRNTPDNSGHYASKSSYADAASGSRANNSSDFDNYLASDDYSQSDQRHLAAYDDSDISWHQNYNAHSDADYNNKNFNRYGNKGFGGDNGPKQRQKIPPSQQKVKRTPIRTLSCVLLLEPGLAAFLDEDLQLSSDSENRLFQLIADYIIEHKETNSGTVLGYWLAQEHEAITPLLGLELPFNDKQALQAEFQQSLQKIKHEQLRQRGDRLIEDQKAQQDDFEKQKALAAEAIALMKQRHEIKH